MREENPFKVCTNCEKVWQTRDEFLSDPDVELEGYQVNFVALEEGLFLFTHRVKECDSTLALPAAMFTDMHEGEIFEDNRVGQPDCDGSCLHSGVVDSCKTKCECAYVRDVLAKVKTWKKE